MLEAGLAVPEVPRRVGHVQGDVRVDLLPIWKGGGGWGHAGGTRVLCATGGPPCHVEDDGWWVNGDV